MALYTFLYNCPKFGGGGGGGEASPRPPPLDETLASLVDQDYSSSYKHSAPLIIQHPLPNDGK